jgi:hypothetical protein
MDEPFIEPGLGSDDGNHPDLPGENHRDLNHHRFTLYAPSAYGQTTVYPNANGETYSTHRAMFDRGARFNSIREIQEVLDVLKSFGNRSNTGSEEM